VSQIESQKGFRLLGLSGYFSKRSKVGCRESTSPDLVGSCLRGKYPVLFRIKAIFVLMEIRAIVRIFWPHKDL